MADVQVHPPAEPAQPALRQERRPPVPDATEVAPGVVRIQLTIAFPGLGHVN